MTTTFGYNDSIPEQRLNDFRKELDKTVDGRYTFVKLATLTNITLSGLQTIDGVALVAGDRVLVKDQTDKTQNGIWFASATAWTRFGLYKI